MVTKLPHADDAVGDESTIDLEVADCVRKLVDGTRLELVASALRTLAALNHPNIGHIYGLEESAGITALVLELIEGPTLAERIAESPIPLEEALAIA